MANRRVSEVIHDQNPLSLPADTTVQQACSRMRQRRVGAVLVEGPDHRLVGIFTGRDAISRVLAEGKDSRTTKLAEVMTPDPDTMPAGRTALDALRLMHDGGYRHVPIVEGGKIIGVVSRGDLRATEHLRLDEETGLWERI